MREKVAKIIQVSFFGKMLSKYFIQQYCHVKFFDEIVNKRDFRKNINLFRTEFGTVIRFSDIPTALLQG
jgi:hypothetical protein